MVLIVDVQPLKPNFKVFTFFHHNEKNLFFIFIVLGDVRSRGSNSKFFNGDGLKNACYA